MLQCRGIIPRLKHSRNSDFSLNTAEKDFPFFFFQTIQWRKEKHLLGEISITCTCCITCTFFIQIHWNDFWFLQDFQCDRISEWSLINIHYHQLLQTSKHKSTPTEVNHLMLITIISKNIGNAFSKSKQVRLRCNSDWWTNQTQTLRGSSSTRLTKQRNRSCRHWFERKAQIRFNDFYV